MPKSSLVEAGGEGEDPIPIKHRDGAQGRMQLEVGELGLESFVDGEVETCGGLRLY